MLQKYILTVGRNRVLYSDHSSTVCSNCGCVGHADCSKTELLIGGGKKKTSKGSKKKTSKGSKKKTSKGSKKKTSKGSKKKTSKGSKTSSSSKGIIKQLPPDFIANNVDKLFDSKVLDIILKKASSLLKNEVKSFVKSVQNEKEDMNTLDVINRLVDKFTIKNPGSYYERIKNESPQIGLNEPKGTVEIVFENGKTDIWDAQYLGAATSDKIFWFWKYADDIDILSSSLDAAYCAKLIYGDLFGFAPYKDSVVEVEDAQKMLGTIFALHKAIFSSDDFVPVMYGDSDKVNFIVLTKKR